MSGWDILACGDMAMPMGMNGKTDMFYYAPWSNEEYTKNCVERFGLKPNYNYTLDHYGGVNDKDMMSYSNIFFSNGMLDPWSGASPLKSITPKLPAVFMEDCSHHLDLREPNELDPESVRIGRQLEIDYLAKWINEYQKRIEELIVS